MSGKSAAALAAGRRWRTGNVLACKAHVRKHQEVKQHFDGQHRAEDSAVAAGNVPVVGNAPSLGSRAERGGEPFSNEELEGEKAEEAEEAEAAEGEGANCIFPHAGMSRDENITEMCATDDLSKRL